MKDISTQRDRAKILGFTLVEMALVLMVLGLLIGAVVSFAEAVNDKYAQAKTQRRQSNIAGAISDFVTRFGYVPCAAPLISTEENFGFSAADASCVSEAQRVGIVPFKTLGLSAEDIYDGYGNLMTFLVFETAYNAKNATTAHHRCRTPQWVDGSSNLNVPKALFCCARDTNADEKVFRGNNMTNPAWPTLQNLDPSPVGEWADVNTVHSGAVSIKPLTYFAYILISHGKNGAYAPIYRGTLSPARMPGKGAGYTSAYDDPSHSGAGFLKTYYRTVKPLNLVNGPEYYDNIVLWRTQEQVISESGVADCSKP